MRKKLEYPPWDLTREGHTWESDKNTRNVMSVSCSLEVTCWERADLLAILYVMFYCVFVTFPFGVLGLVWYLIVSIPDLCLLPYFYHIR